uniref:RNase H type-1 domain-containing protein n=1 Tax=Nicotiana tabacum TaxID=4097 RepID=A0A1S4D7L2_TOBAC|nr:PREDICTED: uncharacterized protein LOC107826898 [Nicotiana tabacum]
MKLNPEKCTFGVGSGKFLGFMVSNRGIEINPDKIKSIEEITVVNNVKAVQRLTGRITALGRFISRSSDKSHHFFTLLKRKNNFEWTPECQQALEELKRYLSIPPLLHTPKRDETIYLYLAEIVVSSVLVREEKGRLAKWAIELGGYDIKYQPRTTIESQILADFVDDFSPTLVPEVEKELLLKSGTSFGIWTLFTEGSTNVRGFGLCIVLKSPVGGIIRQSIKTTKLTNNKAEYKAMIVGLELAKSLRAETVEAKCDSLLVVSQVNGSYEAREDRMQRYLDKIQIALRHFEEWTHVPREQNCEADALENLASSAEEEDLLPGIIVQLFKSVVEEGHAEINSTSLTWDWRNKYIVYLKDGKLPTDPK